MMLTMISIVIFLAATVMPSDGSCGHYDSNMGATFDFSELTRMGDDPSYTVEDGDLPCTKSVSEVNGFS